MSRAAPPLERGAARSDPERHRNKMCAARVTRPPICCKALIAHIALVSERYSQGLLTPFACAKCGVSTLDPTGWDGPGRWLCEQCASGPAPPEPEHPKPDLTRLRRGSRAELEQVALTRRLCLKAVSVASDMGLLKFGRVCGFDSWILTDSSGLCAEGRRLDGKPYPPTGTLLVRKAHTIKNSVKSWPVGILPEEPYRKSFDLIAIAEGGPDLLSLLHFSLKQHRLGILPVAILGRGVCRHGLHPGSLEYITGMRIRIYPHDDTDGLSYANTIVLARQLEQLGCEVDCFIFTGLKKAGGQAITDLNDAIEISPLQASKLEELFP